jgi:hypothetical protein
MNLACVAEHWLVTMAGGGVVDVWADSVEGLAGPAPGNASKVVVAVARFPLQDLSWKETRPS